MTDHPHPPQPVGQPLPAPIPDTQVSDAQIADTAARQAMSTPGVLRLQPGLRHVVGRAARALFTTQNTHDDPSGDADGIDIRRAPDLEITLRVVTATHPAPSITARTVQAAVTQDLQTLTGRPVLVIVVIVDIEDVEDGS